MFTPRPELPAVDFAGRGNYGRLFAGLIASRALASPDGHALMCDDPVPVAGRAARGVVVTFEAYNASACAASRDRSRYPVTRRNSRARSGSNLGQVAGKAK